MYFEETEIKGLFVTISLWSTQLCVCRTFSDGMWSTCPAGALVLVDSLHAGGSMLAGVRCTFRNILLTVVPDKASTLTLTLIARKKANIQLISPVHMT